MAKYLFQLLCVKTRRDSEHPLPIEAAIGTQNMQVRIESQKITKALYGDDSARYCILFRHGFLKEQFQ